MFFPANGFLLKQPFIFQVMKLNLVWTMNSLPESAKSNNWCV